MLDRRDDVRNELATREMIAPADLAPFGALILGNAGHVAEIIAWFSTAAKDQRVRFAAERVAFVLIFDVGDPLGYATMRPGCFSEREIISFTPQRTPRFSRLAVDMFLNLELTGKTGLTQLN